MQRKDEKMGKYSSKVKTPDDPDPRPSVVSESSQETQQAKRSAQKKAVSAFGRQSTILAANTNEQKKTILGG